MEAFRNQPILEKIESMNKESSQISIHLSCYVHSCSSASSTKFILQNKHPIAVSYSNKATANDGAFRRKYMVSLWSFTKCSCNCLPEWIRISNASSGDAPRSSKTQSAQSCLKIQIPNVNI